MVLEGFLMVHLTFIQPPKVNTEIIPQNTSRVLSQQEALYLQIFASGGSTLQIEAIVRISTWCL